MAKVFLFLVDAVFLHECGHSNKQIKNETEEYEKVDIFDKNIDVALRARSLSLAGTKICIN